MHLCLRGPTTPSVNFLFLPHAFLSYSLQNAPSMNCSRLSATNKPSVSAFCLHIVEVIVIFLLPCWIQTQHANLLFLLAAWTKTESPWHWTSTPWWLRWNFISRVQADRVLSSGLRIYFGPNSDVNLNTPILLLCYTGASGPQFARNRDSSMGTQEALLCPPSSSSLFQLSQAATALCSYMTMHTNKHTTIDRSGRWFLSPTSMLCTWMKTDTHTQSGEHWPQLKHSPPPPLTTSPHPRSSWALFPHTQHFVFILSCY